MYNKMTLKEVNTTADSLANMFKAGIAMDKIVHRMRLTQPKYHDFWVMTHDSILRGERLSVPLKQVWSTNFVDAVTTGEESGQIEKALQRIKETTDVQIKIKANITRILYPLGLMGVGIGVFVFYLMFVLPGIAKATNIKTGSSLMKLSEFTSETVNEHGLILLIGFAGAILLLYLWLKTESSKTTIVNFALGLPYLNLALRDLYFGIWANYVAMMTEAGLSTNHSLKLSEKMLPTTLQNSVVQFRYDLEVKNVQMSKAADLEDNNDDRSRWWPFFISQAFIIADSTGRVDSALHNVAPSLIHEGTERLNKFISTVWTIAIMFTAFFALAPLAAFYMEVGTAFRQAGI